MASARRIPEATVARLPVYLRVLAEAPEETISSDHLATRAGVNAAQVRKDLSQLGSYGTRGVGYDTAYLVRQINRELGLSTDRRVAIVGVGNLGRALAGYRGFGERGFRMVAAFDTDARMIGQHVGAVVVHPMTELRDVVRGERVDIAVLATPANVAQEVTRTLVDAGVTSILNFAPVRLQVPRRVAVRQVDLGVELQILSYYEQQAAEGLATDAVAADEPAADGLLTNGLASDGLASGGLASDGLASDGLASDGLASDGLASDGLATDGGTLVGGGS